MSKSKVKGYLVIAGVCLGTIAAAKFYAGTSLPGSALIGKIV